MSIRALLAALVLFAAAWAPRPAAADVDVTGYWSLQLDDGEELEVAMTQTGTSLVLRDPYTSAVRFDGTIDPTTGAFFVTGRVGPCAPSVLEGTSADGDTLVATYTRIFFNGVGCSGDVVEVTGVRTGGCGDGLVEPFEQCDDGNTTAGDGCNATCRRERCWACTGAPSVCTPDPCPLCEAQPRTGCVGGAPSVRRTLQIKDKPNDKGDRLSWTWPKGAAISVADLGDPTTTTAYGLCIYDYSPDGAGGTRILSATTAGGTTCGTKPCWKAKGTTGFTYRDGHALVDGIQQITLAGGEAGRATIKVRAKGVALATPTLPLASPPRVLVQLQNSRGACWDVVYAAIDAVNTPTELSLRSW